MTKKEPYKFPEPKLPQFDPPDLPDTPTPPDPPAPPLPDIDPPPTPPSPIKSKELNIPTPFGKVRFPTPEVPKMQPPQFDDRRMKAFKHTIATDISGIIGMIPVVGDIIADVVEDVHGAELRRILTEEELSEYMRQDKVAPSTIAAIRTFMKIRV